MFQNEVQHMPIVSNPLLRQYITLTEFLITICNVKRARFIINRAPSLSKKVTNRWPFSRKGGENMVE